MFYDELIAGDVANEFGVNFSGQWTFGQKQPVLGGVVHLAHAMGGAAGFRNVFPVGVVMAYLGDLLGDQAPGAAWQQSPFSNLICYTAAAFQPGFNTVIATVHELAHAWGASTSVEDGFGSAVAGQKKPTWYAWYGGAKEWFAESVTVAVFGSRYTAPLAGPNADERERGFLHGLSRPYVDYLGQYLTVNPSAILR